VAKELDGSCRPLDAQRRALLGFYRRGCFADAALGVARLALRGGVVRSGLLRDGSGPAWGARGVVVVLGLLAWMGGRDPATAADRDDDEPEAPGLPNLYLDLRTSYSRVPAGTLSFGFSSPSLSSAIAAFQQLAATGPATLTRPTSASQGVALDVPLTIDLNDRITAYGGFSASTSQGPVGDWSDFAITSWSVGMQAELYQQNGGALPTVTLQSTLTRSVPSSPLATTSLNTVIEFGYALDADETRGLLAGVQDTRTTVDSPLAAINRNLVGYVGAYYQRPDNWKLTGRVGVQSFGGARLLARPQLQPFTQPIIRLDLDRMDDSDNRLFGVTAQIAWTPKPAYQLTLRTPLYAVKD